METKHKVFNLIILDESGSMSSIKNNIISGFNEIVQTVQSVAKQFSEQEHFITLVTFNGIAVKTLIKNENVNKLTFINEKKYCPSSSTPLYDAMGESMTLLKRLTNTLPDCNVLVTILTDGEENSSKEYSGHAIKKMIEELKQKNWTFTYIGADHDVEHFAKSISITNTMCFKKSDADMMRMFEEEKMSRERYSQKIRNNEDTSDDFYTDAKS